MPGIGFRYPFFAVAASNLNGTSGSYIPHMSDVIERKIVELAAAPIRGTFFFHSTMAFAPRNAWLVIITMANLKDVLLEW